MTQLDDFNALVRQNIAAPMQLFDPCAGYALAGGTYTGVIPHGVTITIGGQPITRDAMRRHVVLTADRLTAAGKIVSIDWRGLRPSRGWARHVRRAKARAEQ